MTKKTEKNRITRLFEKLKEQKKKGFIAFVTAGDPDIGTTKKIIFELERSGADLIELGIPFSDPMADGPTIQASSERAVKKGVHIPDVLKLAKDAKAAGVDGVLIVDLPAEEADELKVELDRAGVDLIFLLTSTSDDGRMRLVSSKASGFIYFI